ncbi:MAG: hypothetical protein L0211_24350, partial [Planctomycetaceae bacterium]|nr:hypothetical protein [Planctomycetaceae bacterium]
MLRVSLRLPQGTQSYPNEPEGCEGHYSAQDGKGNRADANIQEAHSTRAGHERPDHSSQSPSYGSDDCSNENWPAQAVAFAQLGCRGKIVRFGPGPGQA